MGGPGKPGQDPVQVHGHRLGQILLPVEFDPLPLAISAGRLDIAKSMGLGVEDGKELDLRTMRDISEKVTPSIGINFCMSDLTWEK